MKPTKCPAKEKKMRQEKRKMRGGGKAKSKSQYCCVTFKPKNYSCAKLVLILLINTTSRVKT